MIFLPPPLPNFCASALWNTNELGQTLIKAGSLAARPGQPRESVLILQATLLGSGTTVLVSGEVPEFDVSRILFLVSLGN